MVIPNNNAQATRIPGVNSRTRFGECRTGEVVEDTILYRTPFSGA
jgi:hypothetical protein